MEVTLQEVAKRFSREWVFRDVNLIIRPGSSLAILGSNGSGKSTLLQIIAGYLSPSKGKVSFMINGHTLHPDAVHKQVSYTAPYIDPVDELTLLEALSFHFRFKPVKQGLTPETLVKRAYLEGNENKQLRYFSSGMKQRLKLLLAVMSDVPLLLLDEPCTNLDSKGITWYRELMSEFSVGQSVVIASNQPHEYDFCSESLDVERFKKRS